MIVDRPEHREILLACVEAAPFAGRHAEQIAELKRAIREAKVAVELPPVASDEVTEATP